VSNSGQQPSFAGQLQDSYRGAKRRKKGYCKKKRKEEREKRRKNKKKKKINKCLNYDTCKKCPTP
jgi:hypothetical protein